MKNRLFVPLCVAIILGSTTEYSVADSLQDRQDLGIPSFVAVGNPINQATGNKYQVERDYTGLGTLPLILERVYNSSQSIIAGSWGSNWRGSYERSIFRSTPQYDPGTTTAGGVMPPPVFQYAIICRPDGKTIKFIRWWPNSPGWITVGNQGHTLVTTGYDANQQPTGWIYTDPEGNVESYNDSGKILSITNRAGFQQTMTYNAAGLLASVTDSAGRSLVFGYDNQNRVIDVIDPAMNHYTYQYDANNNLTAVTYQDLTIKSYYYENTSFPHALTGITDETGVRYATWSYDAFGRAVSSEHAGGVERTTLVYNQDKTASVTDALGTTRKFRFTWIGSPKNIGVDIGCNCGSAATTTYDYIGKRQSTTDFNGNITNYSYSQESGLLESVTDAAGNSVNMTWDTNLRLPLQINESGRATTLTYAANGNLLTRTISTTNPVSNSTVYRTWSYTYTNGLLTKIVGPRKDISDTTVFAYDSQGNLSSITNALGQQILFPNYDVHGKPLTLIDANGVTTTFSYDLRGRLLSRKVGNENTNYRYNPVGQLIRIDFPDGSYITYTYDAAHRLTGIGDGMGNSIVYTLDVMGNRVREEVRDPNNQLVRLRQRVIDGLNHVVKVIGAQGQESNFVYDSNGNVITITDPLGHVTSYSYDQLNRPVSITDPMSGQTQISYDALGRINQVIDARALVTNYSIDGFGSLITQESRDTGTTQNTYDEAGNLKTKTDAKGQTTTYQYDALNRLTITTYQDGSGVRNTYDQGPNGIGRLSQIDELASDATVKASTQYAYDALGRITSESRLINGVTLTTTYTYTNGVLTGIGYPSGRQVSYSLDGVGRISSVQLTDNGHVTTLASNVQYQPFGAIQSFINLAGQTYTRTIDQDGRIAGYNLAGQNWLIGQDDVNRITYQTDAANAQNTVGYGYDNLDRLTGVALPATNLSYGYDATGNRTSQVIGGLAQGLNYSASSNRLQSITGAAQKTYQYDANGSVTADGNNQYVYDTRGRLTQTTGAAGVTQYQIDALGQRVKKSGSTGDTLYAYDKDGRLIAEMTPQGEVRQEYYYLNDLPLAIRK